jgi:hypothetical protein
MDAHQYVLNDEPSDYLCPVSTKALLHSRAVRRVSVHFEYLENWLRDLDVTGQPVRGDLTVHP